MFRFRMRDLSRTLWFEEEDEKEVVLPTDAVEEEELADADGDTIDIPEDLSELTDEELAELRSELREGFQAIRESTPTNVDLLERYAEASRAVAAELTGRREERIANEERVAALEAEMSALSGEDEEDEDAEEAEGDEAEGEAEEAEEAEEEEAEVVEIPVAVEPVPVAASARTVRVPEAARTLPRRTRPLPSSRPQALVASGGSDAGNNIGRSDIPGIIRDVTRGHDVSRFARYAREGTAHAERHPLIKIEKQFPADLVIGERDDPLAVMDRAADPSRIPGGVLTAAGWCAPSETIYDLCELETAEGLISLPEVGVTRGGLKHTLGPDFGDLFTDTGFAFDPSEVDTAVKTCYAVECPEFDETTWSLAGVCITGDLLMRQAFPELIDRYVNGSLVAHQHRLSQLRIAQIIAGSTAEDLSVPAGADGTAAPLLSAIELAAEKIRYRNRMSRSATLEVVLPAWVGGNIRADVAYRNGKDSLSVSDAEIDAWFADRKVAPQYVYNWQDLVDTADAGYPSDVDFLIYPMGTWIGASDEIIRLDALFDSTLLSTNEYTALFTEEQYLVAKRCHDSRVVTVPICPDGAIGARNVTCAAAS